jgi:flagellar hook-associated protein 3 FlgL
MRVSTANSFDATVNNLARRQAELVAQQERLSTGKRVLRASDDPVAATLAESAQNRLTRVQGDLRAMEASRASLAQAESGLAQSGDLIQKARDLIISAGNGSYSQSEREDIARQLGGLREQMLGVANLKDNAGRTLYGGLGGSATPFSDPTAFGALGRFDGQRGQQAAGNVSLPQSLDGNAIWMQVPTFDGSIKLSSSNPALTTGPATINPATATGQSYDIVFSGSPIEYNITNRDTGAVSGPTSLTNPLTFEGLSLGVPAVPNAGDRIQVRPNTTIFKVMQDTIDALGSGVTDRTDRLARTLTELDAGLDRVLLARGYAGEMLNRADSLESLLDTRTVAYEREKSQLEDLDLIKGISDFQNQQVGMEAALKSYAQIQRLSLFEFVR